MLRKNRYLRFNELHFSYFSGFKRLKEAHCFRYAMHLGGAEKYKDLKMIYWLNNTERKAKRVANCEIC